MTVHSETTAASRERATLLAELARGRPTAVLVQDRTGTVHVLPYLDRHQADDPDVVVLMTRDEAITALAALMAAHLTVLQHAGVLI